MYKKRSQFQSNPFAYAPYRERSHPSFENSYQSINEEQAKNLLFEALAIIYLLPKNLIPIKNQLSNSLSKKNNRKKVVLLENIKITESEIERLNPMFTKEGISKSLENVKKLEPAEADKYFLALKTEFKHIYKTYKYVSNLDRSFRPRVIHLKKKLILKFI